jgi:hypothetical protein
LDPMGKCSNAFFSETTNMIKAKLYMNVHWMVLYKLYVFDQYLYLCIFFLPTIYCLHLIYNNYTSLLPWHIIKLCVCCSFVLPLLPFVTYPFGIFNLFFVTSDIDLFENRDNYIFMVIK